MARDRVEGDPRVHRADTCWVRTHEASLAEQSRADGWGVAQLGSGSSPYGWDERVSPPQRKTGLFGAHVFFYRFPFKRDIALFQLDCYLTVWVVWKMLFYNASTM